MSIKNFMLNSAEHENFHNLGTWFNLEEQVIFMPMIQLIVPSD